MNTPDTMQSDIPQPSRVHAPETGSTQINVGTTERIVSAAAGALLTIYGLRNLKSWNGITLAVTGGMLLARGASGYCPLNNALGRNTADTVSSEIEITKSFTINKPREEVYRYWRRLENLPTFMKHLEDVHETSERQSEWKARIPGGVGSITWQAEIVEERENELLSWRSLPDSTVDNAGEIRFKDAPGSRGTEIQAAISYRAPGGNVGGSLAKLLNPIFRQLIKEDLRRFKQLMETGELATNDGQPSARKKDIAKASALQEESNNGNYESTMLERH